MDRDELQFGSLYVTRFAGSFGHITVLTLLPTYINLLDPSGVEIGLFVTALGLARFVGIVPLGWAGDRYDKRTLLVGSLLLSIAAYLLFPFVDSALGFIAARVLQGFGTLGVGLLGLALVGDLAGGGERANRIGKYNAARMAAGVGGTLGAGALYDLYGFGPIFGLLAGLLALATVGVVLFIGPDETTVEGFAFTDLALNRRILTMTSFRAQYAVGVTLVRNWIPIFVGVSVARGGLGLSASLVGVAIAAEKFTNMLCQPYTGRLSDRYGRALFVFTGGGAYGLVALAVPFAAVIGDGVGLGPLSVPLFGAIPVALPVVVALNGLLGVADSFREPASMALFADEGKGQGIASSIGIRSLVWRPGAIAAPMVGGWLMTNVGMDWVFFLGGGAALSGALTFVGVLSYDHGTRALTRW